MATDSEEDDDWTKYADAGYASSYAPWADMVPADEIEDDEFQTKFIDFIQDEKIDVQELEMKLLHVMTHPHKKRDNQASPFA